MLQQTAQTCCHTPTALTDPQLASKFHAQDPWHSGVLQSADW